MLRYSFANEQEEKVEIQTENGFLQIEVLRPDESPVSLATIYLTNIINNVSNTYKVLKTGIDGKTESIKLPVPKANFSLTNIKTVLPYIVFSLSVEADGFYTDIFNVVPVYPNTTTLQRIVLTPVPFGVKFNSR